MKIIAALLIVVSTMQSQEYSEFHGTWIHSKFVEVLNETRSIERALTARPLSEPLYMVIDSANGSGEVVLAYNLGEQEKLLCRKSSFEHAGIKWGIGDNIGPRWIVARDEKAGSYIALTPADSLENQPIVLGKLPSKNTDPMFIIRRMVNASMLTGVWKMDPKYTIEFTNGQQMVVNGSPIPYTLQFAPDGSKVTLITTQGRPLKWDVLRDGPNLTLKPLQKHKGTILPVAVARLRYSGK